MRQMITRLDERLHDALRARARAEGRSVNALVTEILTGAVTAPPDRRGRFRRDAARAGLLVVPPRPKRVPSRDDVIAATTGAGRAVSEALARERGAR